MHLDGVEVASTNFMPEEDHEIAGFSRFTMTLHRPDRTGVDELRQYKALCDRLLPGLRSQSHLYTLVHLCATTYSITFSEYGEVIGGASFRFIRATSRKCSGAKPTISSSDAHVCVGGSLQK